MMASLGWVGLKVQQIREFHKELIGVIHEGSLGADHRRRINIIYKAQVLAIAVVAHI
jgi:hypothetical protein